jgi:hypothetical protein
VQAKHPAHHAPAFEDPPTADAALELLGLKFVGLVAPRARGALVKGELERFSVSD